LDKKAALGTAETVLHFISYFLLVAVILVTMLSFNNINRQNQLRITDVSSEVEKSAFMLNYLRTPITLNNQQTTISELVALAYENDDYKEQLINETNTIINSLYEGELLFKLQLSDQKVPKTITNYKIAKIQRIILSSSILEASAEVPKIYSPGSTLIQANITLYTKAAEPGTWCFTPWEERCSQDQAQMCACNRVGYRLLWECTPCPPSSNKCNYEEVMCK
jgi:hypothetical protein